MREKWKNANLKKFVSKGDRSVYSGLEFKQSTEMASQRGKEGIRRYSR